MTKDQQRSQPVALVRWEVPKGGCPLPGLSMPGLSRRRSMRDLGAKNASMGQSGKEEGGPCLGQPRGMWVVELFHPGCPGLTTSSGVWDEVHRFLPHLAHLILILPTLALGEEGPGPRPRG